MINLPQIFAFYSFKGGVGRSMALVNLAYALAAKGRNVLILDMDLEAPGLSGFLRRKDEIAGFARHDMVDLLIWAKQSAEQVSEEKPLDQSLLPPLSDYTIRVSPEKLQPLSKRKLDSLSESPWDLGRLDVIPIDENRDYYNRLSEVAVAGMDRETLLRVGSLLRSWLKTRRIPLEFPDYYGPIPVEKRSAPYDYVLIDSRTGITEVGGLCIGPLSDQLVVLCGLNDQNVEGTRQFLTEVGVLNPSSDTKASTGKPTLFVASPLPIGEMTTKSERLDRLQKALGPDIPRLFKLSYHPQMALMETIFVRDHQDELLSQEYNSILKPLLEQTEIDSDFDASDFEYPSQGGPISDETRKLAEAHLRSTSINDSALILFFALVKEKSLDAVTKDVDFQLLDRICRAAAFCKSSVQHVVLGRWSQVLSQWAERTSEPALASRRFDEAILRIDRIIYSSKSSRKNRALALINRGFIFGQQGKSERAIEDYTAVIEMPEAPREQKATALRARGIEFGQQGKSERAIEDYTAVIEMPEAPPEQKATALRARGIEFGRQGEPEPEVADYTAVIEMPEARPEDKAAALINRGVRFDQQGKPESAIEDYTAVIEMPEARPEDKAIALINRGVAFDQQGKRESEIADCTAVIEMPEAPVEMKCNAFTNRGWSRFLAGRIEEAIADSRQAVSLNPMSPKAVGNLAVALLVNRQLIEANRAYDEAIELADADVLADLAKDLREAVAKYGALAGADEIQSRIEARAATLKSTAIHQ
jgi:tetratricopeptide (TPR) repeat protein